MKKLIAMILALTMVLCLTACGGEEEVADQTIGGSVTEATKGAEETEAPTEGEAEVVPGGAVFAFTFEGVDIIPGEAFDASKLPEAASLYEVPSCAIEGTDQVYNYDIVEVTAYDDGTGPVIYSIYLVDVDTTTEEGLYLGDDLARVEELYGTDYISDGTQITYTKGETMLILLMENDCVISVEYRMVTE